MSIGSVAFNDPVANFFKAVETARQRNVTAFERIQPMADLKTTERTQTHKTASPLSTGTRDNGKTMGVNTAPAASVRSPQQLRTRILGNYFDAYA